MSSARQRPLVIGLALLLGALAGCGVGQVTQTGRQQAAVNGANGQAGPIAVRDAEFPFPAGDEHFYPRGSSVPLKLTIVNTSGAPDRLASGSSPAARSVRLSEQAVINGYATVRAVAHVVTEPHQSESATSVPGSSAPSTTSAAATPSTPSATATPSTPAEPTTSPTLTAIESADGELSIVLVDLVEDIKPGRTVRVVLVFERAGEVVLQVPIAAPEEPRGEP